MARISVIVPVYKVEPYLDRCVESILAQTYPDFELILVDDGSPDNCPAMCDAWAEKDSRITVIHQANGGLSAARNAGIDWSFAHSDSEWMTFIDSDDWVHPQFLAKLLDAAAQNGVDVSVCGYAETTGEEPAVDTETAATLWTPEDFFIEKNVNAVVAWGKLYRKACFADIRYPVGKIHEDEFVTYKILFAVPSVAVLSDRLYFYYQNLWGIMKSPWSCKRLDAVEASAEQICYLEARGFHAAYQRRLSSFLATVCYHFQAFRRANGISRQELARYREIKRLVKQIVHRYQGELKLSWVTYDWLVLELYPMRARVFLHTRSAILKIKRLCGRKTT